MKVFLISHLVIAVFAIVLSGLIDSRYGLSVAGGAATSLLNIAALGLIWRQLLAKKLVALMILIIVFKFALLVWILYVAARSEFIHLGWFATGLGIVIPSALVTSFLIPRMSRDREKR